MKSPRSSTASYHACGKCGTLKHTVDVMHALVARICIENCQAAPEATPATSSLPCTRCLAHPNV